MIRAKCARMLGDGEEAAMTAGAATALSWEEAQGIVKEVEALFGRADIAGVVAGFTPDAVARFGDFPEMRGRDAVEAFIRARFARQKNYRLQKHLRMVMDDLIGNDWDAQWEDAKTGRRMRGRQIAQLGCGVQRLGRGRRA